MQDCLGLLQDVAVTGALLETVANGDDREMLTHPIGHDGGWQAAAARRARGRLERRFKRFAVLGSSLTDC
jgi:hypothetical protein